jgi:hypothetical protein
MEPISTSTQLQPHDVHHGTDDAVFVSCTAMFALAIVFVSGTFADSGLNFSGITGQMTAQNSATLIEARVTVPVVAPEPTIEQELKNVGNMLGVDPTSVVKK